MTKQNGELVKLDEARFPALVGDSNVLESIRQSMAGEEISPADLTRIKVPSGGTTSWVIEDLDGEATAKTIEGVIVHIARRRAYWPDPNPTAIPPQCSSLDCVAGIGDPGGACRTCRHNEWGTAVRSDGKPGPGKACKETKLIFLLRDGAHLPDVVSAPPASLKAMRKFQLSLGAKGLTYFSVVTRLGLEKAQNNDGTAYARIVPQVAGRLDPEAVNRLMAYCQDLEGLFDAVVMDADDVETAEV